MIISVGYRVNSKKGTQFRIWANNILKQYLFVARLRAERAKAAITTNTLFAMRRLI
jgi:hypothetical protein